MKSIAKALVVGVLVVATQAAAADAFPRDSKQYLFGQTGSTYADSHPVTTARSVFPEYRPEGWRGLPAQSTYADRRANDPVTSAGSAFPVGEPEGWGGLPVRSTYADGQRDKPVQLSQPAQGADNSGN